MTKIDKKQFYVIVGLAGIIATASFIFPLQTAESAHELCPPGSVLFLPDGTCINLEFCMEFDADEHCTAQGDPPVLCPPGFVVLVPDRICIPIEFCMEFNDEEQCTAQGDPPVPVCVLEHWDKIIFSSKKDVLDSAGLVVADKKSIMDIKVIDDPTKVEFPMQKAADKLNSVGWTTVNGVPFTPNDLKLIDIEYALICVT